MAFHPILRNTRVFASYLASSNRHVAESAGNDIDVAPWGPVSSGMGPRARVWAIAVVLIVMGGLFSIVTLLTGRARGAERIVMERWAETLGTPEEVFARYPPREMNIAARSLIDITAAFGLDAAPRSDSELSRPERATIQRFKEFKSHNKSWFREQMSLTATPGTPPPQFVTDYLAEFRSEIDRVQDVLLGDTKPAWKRDLSLLFAAPIPNLLGHIDLNNLLLTDCLAALDSGDNARAERALEAAWELGAALDDDLEMITQLIRLAMLRSQAAVVRQMPWLEHWIPRLDGNNLREAMERSLLHNGWGWPQYDYGASEDEGLMRRLNGAITGPFMKLGAVDASERWRRTILRLQKVPSWCRPALERVDFSFKMPMPWWNRFGSILPFDFEQAVARVAKDQLQFELTRKLLEIAATRRSSGAWPVVGAPWLQSRACPVDRWIYSTTGSVASLGLERDMPTSPRIPWVWQFSLDGRYLEPPRRN
jgi:hypothetical protein